METEHLIRTVVALIFVIGLIGLISFLFQRYAVDRNLMRKGKAKRLKIEEFLYLDGKRKIALVKKDEEEILILLSPNAETIIQTSKTKAKA